MQKKFVDILCSRFPSLMRAEIEQACLLAEGRIEEDNDRLAFRMVTCACLNRLKKEKRLAHGFPSYDGLKFPKELLSDNNTAQLLKQEQEEWADTIGHLPSRVKKLVQIAQEEANAFAKANHQAGVWTRQGLTTVRQAIKARFIGESWTHSENGYYTARRRLIRALRRNKRK